MKVLLKNFINQFVVLNLITQTLSQMCNLNLFDKNWVDEWSLILIQDNPYDFQLVRGHTVPVFSEIQLLCNSQLFPIRVFCTPYQAFNIKLPPFNKCTESLSLMPTKLASYAPYCPYTLYKIGFYISIYYSSQFYETYQVCFDLRHLRPLFTISKAYPQGADRPPSLEFHPDPVFHGNSFSAFSRASTFKRFETLLGNNQPYMSQSNVDHIIDRGHLTPSADFTLPNLKRSTFDMMNVIPQFKTIDNGNWRVIEEWTRKAFRTPPNVCTGVLDCHLDSPNDADLDCVVQLQDANKVWVPMFLGEYRQIPMPLWIYKIVNDYITPVVFLTLNNIYHQGIVNLPQSMCNQIPCPLTFSQTVKEGLTFCCSYHEFIANNAPYLWGVC